MSNHSKALALINQLVEKFGKGGYIFRGTTTIHSDENEDGIYDGINSTLYRWVVKDDKKGDMSEERENLRKIFFKNKKFFPARMEKEIVENAGKMYPSKTEAHEILTDLQHFGGKTNMIDFSRNIHIALFFACQGNTNKSGELIALREKELKRIEKINYDKRSHQEGVIEVIDPAGGQSSRQRANFQGSVFVRPADGYINPKICDITPIPADLKKPLLKYLRTLHNITPDAVYNDLHGFIKNEENNKTPLLYFYMGITSKNKKEYENAIKYYSKFIQSNPSSRAAHNNRGNAYKKLKKYALAIKDFNKAISLRPRPLQSILQPRTSKRGNGRQKRRTGGFC